MGKVPRTKFWVWGHAPGSHNGLYGIPGQSQITPAEGAKLLSIDQIIMVRYAPHAIEPLAGSLSDLREVVWSLVGAGGNTSPEERQAAFSLAAQYPNINGLIFDDFWSGSPVDKKGIALSLNEMKALREQATDQRLDLWSVCYVSEFFRPEIRPYLPLFDRHTLWCWEPRHTRDMEDKLSRFREMVPDKPRYMGVYLWDYGNCCPMPLGRLRNQCWCGLEHLLSGDIAGMIFLPTCIFDLEIEAVQWVREWLAGVRDV